MAIYLTSDWHFCHDQPFIYEQRGFKNIDEMNEAIIAKHNSIVSPEDDVIVLGDLMLNNTEKGIRCVNRLNGNLHIVYGNHDTPKRIQEYVNLKLDTEFWGYAIPYKYKKYIFYLSHYPTLTINLGQVFNSQVELFFASFHLPVVILQTFLYSVPSMNDGLSPQFIAISTSTLVLPCASFA